MPPPELPTDLPGLVRARGEHALRVGAIEPIDTEYHEVADGGVRFAVRVVSSLERKAAARRRESRSGRRASGPDPFLPYDPDLFVADLSATHLCLLNRYKVVDHHLLVVTRAFEEQDAPLTHGDFAGLWACLAAIDGLGFYNSGRDAGASQRHKHLQLVPAPLGAGPDRTPLDPLVEAAARGGGVARAALPFAHAVARLDPSLAARPEAAAAASLARYRELLATLSGGAGPGPHNLLVTRRWMMAVPRRRAAWEGIEVNALGFAGSLLLRRAEQLPGLRRLGPLELLRRVGHEA